MSIKPVLVPDHDAASLRKLMDHFTAASTGPTKRQLTESRAAVAAAQGVTEDARQKLNFDEVYGRYLKVTDNDGDPNKEGFSLVTPLNGASWHWRERPEFKKIVQQKLNEPGFLGDHKYQQIIDAMSGKKFDSARHLAKSVTEARNTYTVVFVDPSDTPKQIGTFDNAAEAKQLIKNSYREMYDTGDHLRNVAPGIYVLEEDYRNTGEQATADNYKHMYHWIIQKSSGVTEENLNEFLAPDGSNYGGGGGGDESRQFRVIITLYDDSSAEDETAERKIGITVTATSGKAACDLATTMLLKSPRYDGSRITNVTARPVLDESGMSRAAKGYEKYGKAGMQALAKAGREGRALDPVRDRYDRYDEAVAEGSADAELKAMDEDKKWTPPPSDYDQAKFVQLIQGYTPKSDIGREIQQRFSSTDYLLDESDELVGLIEEYFYEGLANGSEGPALPDERADIRAFRKAVKMSKTPGVTEGAAGVKYGVFAKGGSVGSQRFRDDPLKTFDTKEEAVADARRRRSGLSKGERGYYRMGYVVKPIKGSAEQVDEIDMGLVGDAMAGAAAGLGSVGLGSYIGHKIGNKIGQKFIDRSNRKEAERRAKEKQDRNQQVAEKSEAVRHANNPHDHRSRYPVDESVDPIEQLRADIRRFAQ